MLSWNGGSGSVSLSNTQIKLASDTTLTAAHAANANNVTEVELASGASLTISSAAFDTSSDEWSSLTTLTGLGGTNNLIVTTGATKIDLFNLNTLTDIDAVTIADTAGADTINLSPTLTTSGITTINLSSDSETDKIYFGVSETDYVGSGSVAYTTVNGFNTSHDRVGLYYYDFDADSGTPKTSSAIAKIKTTGSTGGTSTLSADRTLVEDDTNLNLTPAISNYDAVSQIKTIIGDGISSTETAWHETRLVERTSRLQLEYVSSDPHPRQLVSDQSLRDLRVRRSVS